MHIIHNFTWIPFTPIHSPFAGVGFLAIILALFIWLLPIIIIFAVIDWIFTISDNPSGYDNSLEILKERYAKGEISKKEFEEKKRYLQS